MSQRRSGMLIMHIIYIHTPLCCSQKIMQKLSIFEFMFSFFNVFFMCLSHSGASR